MGENTSREVSAIFVLEDGTWHRKTAIRETPEELRGFLHEDDHLRTLPDAEKDILTGPPAIIKRMHLTPQALAAHIERGEVRVEDFQNAYR